jgi:hypothetical protein
VSPAVLPVPPSTTLADEMALFWEPVPINAEAENAIPHNVIQTYISTHRHT